LINAGLGVFGIYSEMNWLLSFFGKSMDAYPVTVHIVPFVYYVLYTFLLRQAVLDATGSRSDEARRTIVNRCYVGASLLIYGGIYLLS
jgi:hypothetical protein